MTAKERRYVRKLEIRVQQLEAELTKIENRWVGQYHDLFESRTALLQAFEAIEEAAGIIHTQIKDDPQFMARRIPPQKEEPQ